MRQYAILSALLLFGASTNATTASLEYEYMKYLAMFNKDAVNNREVFNKRMEDFAVTDAYIK